MTAITFDTHLHVKRLRDKGVPEAQAEAIVESICDAREQSLQEAATKADINELRAEIRELDLRMTIKMGAMIMTLGGILIAIKYFG